MEQKPPPELFEIARALARQLAREDFEKEQLEASKQITPKRTSSDVLRERNNVRQVAEYWGVSPDTIRRLVDGGKLDAIRIGSVVRITREHVLAYEAANSTVLQAKKDKAHADAFRTALNDPFEQGREIARQARIRASQKGEAK